MVSLTSIAAEVASHKSEQQHAAAHRVDKKDPYKMIELVAQQTFKRFANEQVAIQANPNLLKDIGFNKRDIVMKL